MAEKNKQEIKRKHIIRTQDLKKVFSYGQNSVPVLKGINVHIYPQEMTIIYGESGSGKSTLLNTLIGLEEPSEGFVYVQGKNLFGLSEDDRAEFRNRHFGVVYQHADWVKSLNVLDNVALPLVMRGNNFKFARARATFALQQVEMEKFSQKHPSQLSGGEQQRVNVARALASDPIIIFADEPTGNLDTQNGNEVIDIFRDLVKRYERSIVMITHELRFLEVADKGISIKDGMVDNIYNPEELKKIVQKLKTAGIK